LVLREITIATPEVLFMAMARDFAEKSAARQWVWDRLIAEGVARFPFPPHGRIPNFVGAAVAAARLLDIDPWKHGEIMDPAISKPHEALAHWQATKSH
jgi:hypothetical protein